MKKYEDYSVIKVSNDYWVVIGENAPERDKGISGCSRENAIYMAHLAGYIK